MAIATCGPPADGPHQPWFDRQEGSIMRLFHFIICFVLFFCFFAFSSVYINYSDHAVCFESPAVYFTR
jgi:hypothetical protein